MVFPKRNSDFQSPNPEVPGGSHAHFDWLEIGHVTPEAIARMSVTTEELRTKAGRRVHRGVGSDADKEITPEWLIKRPFARLLLNRP